MLITFEGIEGSGKTTQIKHVARFLNEKGHDCVITREPGGTEIGKKIRSILLDPKSKGIDPLAEFFLYAADRTQHLKEVVNPCLSLKKTVLCDRFFDATVVYQGFARGLDLELIHRVHRFILQDLRPDITILLDLPPEIGLSRAWGQIKNGTRIGFETRFENEKLVFHETVRSGYLKLASLEPQRFKVVNAVPDETRVRNDVIKVVNRCLGG